jgi:hypothetical protein
MKLSIIASQLILLAAAAKAAETAAGEEPPFKWPSPFKLEALKEYEATCESSVTLQASEYQLHDLYESAPAGLWNWADALKVFFGGQEYPGSWEGLDPHRYDRHVLKMEYADLPREVRDWIALKGQKLFAVYEKPKGEWKKVESQAKPPKTRAAGQPDEDEDDLDKKVIIFAPGALYEVLPLFAAKGSACAGMLPNSPSLDCLLTNPRHSPRSREI